MGDNILDMMKEAYGNSSLKEDNRGKQTAEYRVMEAKRVACVACGVMELKEKFVRRGMCPSCVTDFEKVEGDSKDNESKHPTSVPGWDGTLTELAHAVENLRYDKAAEFIYQLSMAFRERARADREAGKWWLATQLSKISGELGGAHFYTHRAWEICKPHMNLKGD